MPPEYVVEGNRAEGARNRELVHAFLETWDEQDPPSIRQISVGTGFSMSGVHGHLRRLVQEGRAERRPVPVGCVHCAGTGRVFETRYFARPA